ncbi:hypothetical protein KUTeg_007009 [Tegillarca granosa]|uniref:TIR domain-containing protein n=1 Tax=Tegillarca granosa TaxID=220873 RepID=A0ABQ9FC03_TEGGR|nr:hypothetical protein KUTeg_007009 [Tegillarca granosa]
MEEENTLLSRGSSEDTELKRLIADNQDLETYQSSTTLCDLPEGKKYHLFVSCSSNDNRSIEPILETLKDCYNIKCVQPEHFIAGKPVLQNINDLIVESMKILIVITPNYLESNFCNYEKCLAFFIHAGERRHCLIPLLLKPCNDLPVEFKQLTYIDAETEQDIPARIVDALKNNDTPNCLVPKTIPEYVWRMLGEDIDKPSRDQNGHPLFFINAVKLTEKMFGNQWQFKSLTKTEEENMEKSDIKMGEFYETLIDDLNSQRLMKHFGALIGRPQLGLKLLLSVIVGIFSIVNLYCIDVLISGVYKDPWSLYLVLAVLSVGFMVSAVILGTKIMLMVSMADDLIESKIVDQRKSLYTWSTLPMSISKRHNTYLRKKCLCELIEDTLLVTWNNNNLPIET